VDIDTPEVSENEELIPYKHEMKKPDFNEMVNKDDIQQQDYNAEWTKEYALTKEDVDTLSSSKYCSNGYSLIPYY
jgi:ribosome biogenesis GTPase A